jgi:murein DD-endopeptidase MepM/ murein hydrolase activator NlpD
VTACSTALGLALFGWAACGEDHEEPGVVSAGAAEDAPIEDTEAEEAEPAEVFVEHTVAEGETLWDIARGYDVRVADIMEANELRPSDVRRMSKGRTLRIPGATAPVAVETAEQRRAEREELPALEDGAYHTVAEGETLWDIARTYDVGVDALMERNEFSDDDARTLGRGEVVIVPGIRQSQVRAAARPDASGGARRRRDGIVHEVARGETVWDLANAFQVSVAEIMAANGLDENEVTGLREGARLFLPGVTEDRGRIRRRETAAQGRARPIATRLGLGTRAAASSLLRGIVERAWIRAAGGQRERLPGTLRWPVSNGWFVRGYGSGEGGYHLATDIAGEIGWNVRAAAPGIVGYSGNEVSGYGNMVLVIHPGGWVTMYAHNSTNYVVAGERVARGGVLAEVGSTGISRGPHVHFEFIFDGRNCDPSQLFRPGIRHRNGRMTPIDPLSWARRDRRPREIDCAPRRRHPRSRWVINE